MGGEGSDGTPCPKVLDPEIQLYIDMGPPWAQMNTNLGAALRYFFLFLKIRFWDELGPYGRWGAVQHVKIKFISILVFLISKKKLGF